MLAHYPFIIVKQASIPVCDRLQQHPAHRMMIPHAQQYISGVS
jgi:hypothetical protein